MKIKNIAAICKKNKYAVIYERYGESGGVIQYIGDGAVFCNPPYGREIGKWVKKAYEEARGGGTPLYCLSQRERIRPTFTITYTEKRKSASFAGGFASQTTKGTPEIPRPSLLW